MFDFIKRLFKKPKRHNDGLHCRSAIVKSICRMTGASSKDVIQLLFKDGIKWDTHYRKGDNHQYFTTATRNSMLKYALKKLMPQKGVQQAL